MRSCLRIVFAILASSLLASEGAAQVTRAGDLDPLGRVMTKIRIRVTDSTGVERSVARMNVVVTSEKGIQTTVPSDDAGIATAFLETGNYRITTPEAITWERKTLTWDLVFAVSPGNGALTLSELNAAGVDANPVPATPVRSRATAPPSQPTATTQPRTGTLRVFIDCPQTSGCDQDYFRTEVPFVDYMRDRADASVHLLATEQSTGGGGLSYTLNFIGMKEFAGLADTLTFVLPASATQDEKRKALAHGMKLGLVRYVARTPASRNLTLNYSEAKISSPVTTTTADPWNLWVFQTTGSASFQGEELNRFLFLRGSTSANRTSRDWKIEFGLNGGYNESKYTFSDGSEYNDYTRNYGATHLIVRSLGDHWGVGERASLSSSTYLNRKLFLFFEPTIEFNVFPYSQATRRKLTFSYSIGANSFAYEDTTIYNKIKEFRVNQTLVTALGLKQPWGSASVLLEAATYLDDFSKRHATLYNQLDLRLFKGFSLNTYFGITLLHDQLSLAKGELTDEQILLQRRQVATEYSYYGGIGLSYTFGSIFNNVVNPRFDVFK